MSMRKIFALIILILACSSSYASDKNKYDRFVTFPAIGTCTGTHVRYRKKPDTKSKILGRINSPQNVIVLSQKKSKNELWYEIENPERDSRAWVSGKYIVPLFSETTQNSELYPIAVSIMQTYGINPVKAKLNSGHNAETEYRHDNLVCVEASKKGNSFGGIKIGDSEKKLNDTLGIPDRKQGNRCEYIEGEDFRIVFFAENGKIYRMMFVSMAYFKD